MQNTSRKQRYLAIGIIIVFMVALFWLMKSHSFAKQVNVAGQAVKVTTAKEADKDIPLEISGFVRGENRAEVSPMISGRILRIFKHEGQSVKKGDILATVDANQSDAQVSAASASVDALQKTLEDTKKYYNQLVNQAKESPNSNIADETVKSAKRGRDLQIQAANDQLIAARGALGIAQVGKNNSTIIAPFSGTVTTLYGHEGGFANFSMPIISISTQNSKEIETYVSATDGRGIFMGSVATLRSSNGLAALGTVTAVSAGSDTQSLKTLIRIHIDDASNAIYLGDFMRGEISTVRLQSAVSIPRSAVVSRGGDQVVFILDNNNIAKEQAVKIASEHNGLVDVIDGISINQKIVTEGQQYLINGSKTIPYETN